MEVRSPPSLSKTSRTCRPLGRQRKMMSLRETAPRTEPAIAAPCAARRASGSRARSNAVTGEPLLRTRLPHIGSPMTPSPMQPMVGDDMHPPPAFDPGRLDPRNKSSRAGLRLRRSEILQEPFDVIELKLRTQGVGEASAQFLEDASRPLRVDFSRHFYGDIVAIVASAQWAPERIGILLGARWAGAAGPPVRARTGPVLLHLLREV